MFARYLGYGLAANVLAFAVGAFLVMSDPDHLLRPALFHYLISMAWWLALLFAAFLLWLSPNVGRWRPFFVCCAVAVVGLCLLLSGTKLREFIALGTVPFFALSLLGCLVGMPADRGMRRVRHLRQAPQ